MAWPGSSRQLEQIYMSDKVKFERSVRHFSLPPSSDDEALSNPSLHHTHLT